MSLILEKTIKKVYGTGDVASTSQCPECESKLQNKGLKKNNFL